MIFTELIRDVTEYRGYNLTMVCSGELSVDLCQQSALPIDHSPIQAILLQVIPRTHPSLS